MNVKVLKSDHRQEGGNIVIVRQTEEVLSPRDLVMRKQQIAGQKMGIAEQMRMMRKQYDDLVKAEDEVDGLLASLAPTDLPEIP